MSQLNPHIALLIMCKNESERMHITLNSVKGIVKSIVAYDTGSTDDTVNIIKKFCMSNKIACRLKEGTFVDFSTSRNVALDFADKFEDIDYLLLMDINDELRGGENLLTVAREYLDRENSCFMLCQEWWSGKFDKYYNMRFIKPRNNWRFSGRVHEYISQNGSTLGVVKVPDDKVVLYQDRIADNNKSGPRFSRDKKLLLEDYEEDPTEPRTVFYLAQTCGCLGQWEEAIKYYETRSNLDGFDEEIFHSYLRSGELKETLNRDWYESFVLYMKAFEHSQRAEPLVKIATHYVKEKKWKIAFTFINLACSLEYPVKSILFVNSYDYYYLRWHILGIIGWYSKNYKEGEYGARKALEYCEKNNKDTTNDMKNLEFYKKNKKEEEEVEVEVRQTNEKPIVVNNMTKKQFTIQQMVILKKENPKMNEKQIVSKIKKMWKNRNKK